MGKIDNKRKNVELETQEKPVHKKIFTNGKDAVVVAAGATGVGVGGVKPKKQFKITHGQTKPVAKGLNSQGSSDEATPGKKEWKKNSKDSSQKSAGSYKKPMNGGKENKFK